VSWRKKAWSVLIGALGEQDPSKIVVTRSGIVQALNSQRIRVCVGEIHHRHGFLSYKEIAGILFPAVIGAFQQVIMAKESPRQKFK